VIMCFPLAIWARAMAHLGVVSINLVVHFCSFQSEYTPAGLEEP
jgi:hypothetical protein